MFAPFQSRKEVNHFYSYWSLCVDNLSPPITTCPSRLHRVSVQMEKEELVGNFRCKDLIWLLSLPESDLEWLISLQRMVVRRAGVVGHESFAKKFNVKMLRALGFIVMQCVKKQYKGILNAGLSEFVSLLNASNLLNCNLENGVKSINNGDLEIDIHMLMNQKKRKFPRSSEHSSSKRLKSTVSEIP